MITSLSLLTIKNLSVLLLVAVMLFPIAINQSYAQSLQNQAEVTGTAPVAPTVSSSEIEVLIGTDDARVITLPFSTLVTSSGDTSSDVVTVTFSIRDDADNALITNYIGTNVTGTAAIGNDDVATVTSGATTVTIQSDHGDDQTADVIISYVAENAAEQTSPGTITLKFVHAIGTVAASPYTVMLDDLFDIPLTVPVTDAVITGTLLATLTLGDRALAESSLTVTSPGNGSGTLVYDPNTTPPTLAYTPTDDFDGNEGFAYTITLGAKSATSEFIFNVPSPVCTTSTAAGANFGGIAVGATSTDSTINIDNMGNTHAMVMMSGAQWLSVATPTVEVMNADQTKWSLTADEAYSAKTALGTTTPDIISSALGEGDVDVYLQLLITLLNDTFRGEITQALTITSTCE